MFDLSIRKRFSDFELDVSGRSTARVLGVVGPSGSGKSTLLNVVAGFTIPDEARLVVGERRLSSDSRAGVPVRRRGVGYVAQEPLLFPHLTVRQNLTYGYAARGHGPRFDDVVDLLEVRGLLHRSARALSGGEARRVAIGRAVLSAPCGLLLDEPLAGLDARLAARTLALLRRVQRALQMPTLYVSHTVSDVLFLCDEAWRLTGGRLVGRGAPRDLLADAGARDTSALSSLRNHFIAHRAADRTGAAPTFHIGSQPLTLAEDLADPRADTDSALLSVHASDIMLARERPRRISARNVLTGRVTCVFQRDGQVLVGVDVGVWWMVRVTPAAVEELELAQGADVFVIVKASALSAVPA